MPRSRAQAVRTAESRVAQCPDTGRGSFGSQFDGEVDVGGNAVDAMQHRGQSADKDVAHASPALRKCEGPTAHAVGPPIIAADSAAYSLPVWRQPVST